MNNEAFACQSKRRRRGRDSRVIVTCLPMHRTTRVTGKAYLASPSSPSNLQAGRELLLLSLLLSGRPGERIVQGILFPDRVSAAGREGQQKGLRRGKGNAM